MARNDLELIAGFNVDTSSLMRGVNNAASQANNALKLAPQIDTKGIESLSRPLGRVTGQADEFTKSMEAANARVIAFGASVGVLRGIMQAFKDIVNVSMEVEDTLNQIAAASNSIDTKNLKGLSNGLFDISKQIGVSFKEVSVAALEFSRQGKGLEQTLTSTRAALALVRTTGIDATSAVRGLTAAVNAFADEGLTYEMVVNKMAAVDSKFAVSSKDLIEGISRSASVAQEAGVSFDQLAGLITALQEKTARGGPVIGNALKTIFTRLSSNNNLTFLRDLGLELYDLEGKVLPAVNIITQLSEKLEGLEGNLRKATLVKLGGGFQVDKMAALVKDVADVQNGKFAKAADASANAGSNAFDRIEKLNMSTKHSFDEVITSATQLASILGSVQFTSSFKTTLDKISFVTDRLNSIMIGNAKESDPDKQGVGTKVTKGLVTGVTDIIMGPGAALISLVFIKIVKDLVSFVGGSVKSLIGADTVGKQNESIQKSIIGLLSNNLALQKDIFSEENTRADQLLKLSSIYNAHITQLQKIKDLSRNLAPDIIALGYGVDPKEGLVRKPSAKIAAEGYLSPSVAYAMEKQKTPPGHHVIRDPNFPIGGGKTVDMFYNSSETRKTNIHGSGSDAIIPNFAKIDIDEIVRQRKNELLSSAGLETIPKERKGGVSLNVDARLAGVGALTMAARPEGAAITRRQSMSSVDTQKALEKFSAPQRSFLEQFDSISLDNLPVGALYNRLGKANDKEKDFKQAFKTRLNAAINPAILNFSQEELIKNAGITIDPKLLQTLKNQSSSLNFIDDTAAGVIFEGMVRLPLVNSENDIKAFTNRGADEFFDLFNLPADLAERYKLPRQIFPYVEVKSDLKKVQEHIIGKFLGQASKDGRLQSLLGLQNSQNENLINAKEISEKPIFSIADKDRSPESRAARNDLKKSYPEIFNKLVASGAISAFNGFVAASGFMPDSGKAIQKAWEKEKKQSGLPDSHLSVVYDKSLQGVHNPFGAAIINKRDEPDGKIPNFANPASSELEKFNAILTKFYNIFSTVGRGVKTGAAYSAVEEQIKDLTTPKKDALATTYSSAKIEDILEGLAKGSLKLENVLEKINTTLSSSKKTSTATQTVQAQAIDTALAADEGTVEDAKAAAPALAKRNRETNEQRRLRLEATAEVQRKLNANSGAAGTTKKNVDTGFTMGPTYQSNISSLPTIPELPAKLKGKKFDYFNQDSFDRSIEDLNEQYTPAQRKTANYKSKVEQLRKDATITREPVTAQEIADALKKIEATEARLKAIKDAFARNATATTTTTTSAIDSASIAAKQKEIQAKISTPQPTQPTQPNQTIPNNDAQIQKLKAELEKQKLEAYNAFNSSLETRGGGVNKKQGLLNDLISQQDKGLSIGKNTTNVGFYKDAIAKLEAEFAAKITKLSEQVKTDVPAAPQIQEAIIAEAINNAPAPTEAQVKTAVQKAVKRSTGTRKSRPATSGQSANAPSVEQVQADVVASVTETVTPVAITGGGGGKRGGGRRKASGGDGGGGGNEGGSIPLFDYTKPLPVNVVLPKVLDIRIVASSIKFGESISDRTLASFAKKAQESQGQEASSKEIEAQENKMWAEKEAQDKKILESARKQAVDAEKHKEDMLAHQVRMLKLASQLEAAETKLLNDKAKRAEAETRVNQPVEVKQPKEKPLTRADQKFIQDQINKSTPESVAKNISLPFISAAGGIPQSSILSAAQAAKQNLQFSSRAPSLGEVSSNIFYGSGSVLSSAPAGGPRGDKTYQLSRNALASALSERRFNQSLETTLSRADLESNPIKPFALPTGNSTFAANNFYNIVSGQSAQLRKTDLERQRSQEAYAKSQYAEFLSSTNTFGVNKIPTIGSTSYVEPYYQAQRDVKARNQKIDAISNDEYYRAAYRPKFNAPGVDAAQRIGLEEKYSKFAETSMTRREARKLAVEKLTEKFGSTSGLDAALSYQPNLINDKAAQIQVNEAMKKFRVALTEASNIPDFKAIGQPLVKYVASLIAGSVSLNQFDRALITSQSKIASINMMSQGLIEEKKQLQERIRSSGSTPASFDVARLAEVKAQLKDYGQEKAVEIARVRSYASPDQEVVSKLLSSKTSANLTAQLVVEEQKLEQQRRKEMGVSKDLTQSAQESVFKLFAYQTAISGVTGVLSQFGTEAATLGNILSGTVGSFQIYKQTANLAQNIFGKKEVFQKDENGKEIKVLAFKTFGDLTGSIFDAYKSASQKSLSEGGNVIQNFAKGVNNVFTSNEQGGSLTDVLKLVGGGLTYVVAGFSALATTMTAVDAIVARYNGSLQRGNELSGRFADINQKYQTSLTENQRQAVERTSKSAISSSGFFDNSNIMIGIKAAFDADFNKSFVEPLRKAKLSEEKNKELLKQLSTQFAPIAETDIRTDLKNRGVQDFATATINPQELKDRIDSYVKGALDEIINASYRDVQVTQFNMIKGVSEPTGKTVSEVSASAVPLAAAQYSEALAKNNAQAVLNSKQLQSSFGLSVEIEKQRLNIIQQIAKAQDSISSSEQNRLTIQKDLNSTMESERTMLDYRVRKIQEEKQTMSEIRQSALTTGRKQIDAVLDTFGSAFKKEKQPELENAYQNLANATSQEDQIKAYEDLIKIVNKLGAGGKELVDLFKLQFREITSISAARQIENVLQLQNTTYIKQQNYELQKQKDLITGSLNARVRMAELDQQKREIGYSISDTRYQTQQSLIGQNQSPIQKQFSDLFRSLRENNLRDTDKLKSEQERNTLSNRQNLLNLVLNRTGDLSKVKEVANAKTPEQALQKATDILNEESASFAKAVTDSAIEFNNIIVQAANQLSLILSGQSSGNAEIDKAKILLNSNTSLPKDVSSLIKLIDITSSLSSGFQEKLNDQGPKLRLNPKFDTAGNPVNSFYSSLSDNDQKLYQDFIKGLNEKTEAARKALTEAQGKQVTPFKLTPAQTSELANQQPFPLKERKDQISATKFRDVSNVFTATTERAFSLEKELGAMRINAAQRALDLEKEKLGLSNRQKIAEFNLQNLGMNPSDLQEKKARFDIAQTYDTGLQTYKYDTEKAELGRKQAAFNYLNDKIPSSESKKILTGELDVNKAVNDYFNNTKTDLSSKVTDAAKEFYRIVTDAGYALTGKTKSEEDVVSSSKNAGSLDAKTLTENKDQISKAIEKLQSLPQSDENNAKIKEYTDALSNLDSAIVSLQKIPTNFSTKQIDALINPPIPPAKETKDTLKTENKSSTVLQQYQQYQNTQFGGGISKSATIMEEQMKTFQSTLGETIPMAFRDGLVSAMKAATDGTKSLKQGLLGVASAFGQKINDVLMNNIANQVTAPLTRALTPSWGFGGDRGNGYASGGYIGHGSGTKDDVPAMLMKGEYVLNKNIVSKYGSKFFEDLNSGKIKKFATGGIVGGEIDITKPLDPKMTPYGETRSRGLSFDKSGSVIGIDNYSGREEDKGDALKKAQTGFYANTAQTGEGGFYTPGQYGKGAIMGQKNLLSFVTQQTVSDQYDNIKSTRSGASIDLAGGSSNLTIQALMNKDNLRNQEYSDAKSKALDLYMGGIDAAKSKTKQDEDNRIAYEKALAEREKQKKEQEKQLIRGLITQFATAAVMAGLSAAATSAANGHTAAMQAWDQGGRVGEKPGMLAGTWSGAKIGGQQYGGLSNVFNSSGYQTASLMGIEGGGAKLWNSQTNKYEPMSPTQYDVMFPKGVSWGSNMVGKPIGYSWKKAAGGYIPGQGAHDDVPAMLTGGEFVMSKQASSNIGYGNLQKMNSTGKQGSDSGSSGVADRIEAKLEELFEKVSGVGSIEINIDANGKENSSSKEDSGKDAQNRELAKKVKDVVLNVLREEKRLGGILR